MNKKQETKELTNELKSFLFQRLKSECEQEPENVIIIKDEDLKNTLKKVFSEHEQQWEQDPDMVKLWISKNVVRYLASLVKRDIEKKETSFK